MTDAEWRKRIVELLATGIAPTPDQLAAQRASFAVGMAAHDADMDRWREEVKRAIEAERRTS